MNSFTTIDYAVFIFYFILITGYGYWIYSRKKNKEVSGSHDFFLAEGSLTWWAIGASLIASNISAEQFIGMSGQGFQVGIAVAAYEWVAAIALIIVAVWFIPVYLKNKIYTMPQFLQTRYNETVSLIMAVFWLFLYIFVNLTSILYLGAIAISSMVDPEYFKYIVLGLAAFSLLITLGGMKVIGFTDVKRNGRAGTHLLIINHIDPYVKFFQRHCQIQVGIDKRTILLSPRRKTF